MGLRASAASAALLGSATLVVTTVAVADPMPTINLAGSIQMQSQKDPRWAQFGVGPSSKPGYDGTGDVNIGRCGCLLTSLSTVFTDMGAGGLPWFSSVLIDMSDGTGQPSPTFSPRYINEFLIAGPRPVPWPKGSGFLPGSGGNNCGVAIWPNAPAVLSEVSGVSLQAGVPTGLTWISRGWHPLSRLDVDVSLLNGVPAVVFIRTYKDSNCEVRAGGTHANLIVGWVNEDDETWPESSRGKYLIFDPVYHPLSGARTPLLCGASAAEGYSNYTSNIDGVHILQPTSIADAKSWLFIKDDPEPIELRLTDPKGRRTGHDPTTGLNVQEDADSFYDESTSFTDPLLELEEAPVYRYIGVRDPEPGAYGLEVFGIGDGPYTLTLSTAVIDQQVDEATVTGTIVDGEVIRYEIVRSAGGAVTIEEVAAFAPRARAGNDASVFLGNAVAFDGRGSYQIDGDVTDYEWDFGDGESASGAQQTHVYATAGLHTATLTVSNEEGLGTTDERTVDVIDPASLPQMETILVNLTSTGEQATGGESLQARVTPDGRYVAFQSFAPNLVSDDTNATSDIFVKDLSDGTIERVSVATGGAEAISEFNDQLNQSAPTISPDGRFVFFFSEAPNLVAGDEEFTLDLYVRDRTLETTELVLPSSSFTNATPPVRISDDARYVAFDTPWALVPEDTNYPNVDVYVFDRETATLERVSVATETGAQGNGYSTTPRMSADGNLIAFSSGATNLVAGATNGTFVRDRQAGTTELVSLGPTGAAIVAGVASMSSDGRYVLLGSYDNDVFASDENAGNGDGDLFLRDRLLMTTEHVSVSSTGEGANRLVTRGEISPDGRFVSFVSISDNLAPRGTLTPQLYLRDVQEQTTTRVSVGDGGSQGDVYDEPVSSPVGLNGAVVFSSYATTLVPNDLNGSTDVFMRRLVPESSAATTPLANLGGPYLGWASSDGVPAGIRLDARESADPQDRELVAHWDFGDGETLDGELVTVHAYDAPGTYGVTLTVSAGDDESETITTQVDVLPTLPADDLSSGACAAPGGTLSIAGAAVTANADLVGGGWDTSAGRMPIGAAVVTTPWGDVEVTAELPSLQFRTGVTVPAGLESGTYAASTPGAEDVAFTVPCGTLANEPPLAVAGGPHYQAEAGVPVLLDGTGSTDAEGDPLTHRWDFGDDSEEGGGATAEHTYAFAGRYMVTLVVNDGTSDSAARVGTRSFAMVTVVAGDGPGATGAGGAGGGSDDMDDAAGDDDGCGCDCAIGSNRREKTPQLALAVGLIAAALARRRGSSVATRSR